MPLIDAVVLLRWVPDDDGNNVPDAVDEIYAWAIANDEYLPEGSSGVGPFGRYEDITGQDNVHQRILDDLGIFAAKLQLTPTTAAQFAADPRFWTLGYRRLDDDGEVVTSNWDEPLSVEQRQQAVTYITTHSAITAQQLAAVFDASDTRLEIARKLKEFFRG